MEINFPNKNSFQKLTTTMKKEYSLVGLIGLWNLHQMVELLDNINQNFLKTFKKFREVFSLQEINQERLQKDLIMEQIYFMNKNKKKKKNNKNNKQMKKM